MSAWTKHRQTAGVSYYASLIVVPHADMGWMSPDLVGFVTRENDYGVVVCEQAEIRERP